MNAMKYIFFALFEGVRVCLWFFLNLVANTAFRPIPYVCLTFMDHLSGAEFN